MRIVLTLSFAALLAAGHAGVAAAQTGGEAPRAQTLIMGKVDDDPKKTYPRVKGFVEQIGTQLRPAGIVAAKAVLFPTSADLIEAFRRGAVDFTTETLHTALGYRDRAQAVFLLREWRREVSSYRTLLVARKDSGIERIDQLAGKRIAFEDPRSTSAFRMPLALLRTHGLRVLPDASPGAEADPAVVKYAFAGSERNIFASVHQGKTDAGAISDRDWDNPAFAPPAIREELKVIHESPMLIRSLVVARGDLPTPLAEALKRALTGMHETGDGRRAMAAYFRVSRYDEIVGEVREQLEASIRLLQAAGD